MLYNFVLELFVTIRTNYSLNFAGELDCIDDILKLCFNLAFLTVQIISIHSEPKRKSDFDSYLFHAMVFPVLLWAVLSCSNRLVYTNRL